MGLCGLASALRLDAHASSLKSGPTPAYPALFQGSGRTAAPPRLLPRGELGGRHQ